MPDGARPIIRQFGSKARVANRLLALVPPDTSIWVEVFCGTAAVTLAKEPAGHDEHINDLNGDIVNLFRVIRAPGARARLCEAVALTPWSEGEYSECRAEPASGDPVEDARRYLVRSWQGMAGASIRHTSWIAVDRSNKRRPLIWRTLPGRIAAVAERLSGVCIHQRPALEVVKRFRGYHDAVLFADPPYPESAINSRQAYAVNMSDGDHAEFAEALRDVGGAVILTMAPNTIYDEVLADWRRLALRVRGLRNTVKEERIFLNFKPAPAQHLLFGEV